MVLAQAFLVWNSNQPTLARLYFSEASRRDPKDPFILLELAKCHNRLHDQEAAQSALDRVRRLSRKDPMLVLLYGQACEQMRRTEAALSAYARLANHNALGADALAMRAALLERLNRLDEAERDLDRSRKLNPSVPLAMLTQARLDQRCGRLDQARATLEKLLTSSPVRSDKQVNGAVSSDILNSAAYLLASVYDKQGRYDQAMAVLDKAKRRQTSDQQVAVARRGFDGTKRLFAQLLDELDESSMASWAAGEEYPVDDEGPTAFLIGHPRSGTTLIEQMLDAHSQIVSADETRVFYDQVWTPLVVETGSTFGWSMAQRLAAMTQADRCAARLQYRKHMATELGQPIDGRLLLDKNPALTLQVHLITRVMPRAKLIMTLRDPRDVVLSAYMQAMTANNWSVNWLTLSDAVDMYCFAMTIWLRLREKTASKWIEVRYEDCVEDISTQGRKITAFLGLEWDDKSQARPHEHVKSKAVFSPSYEQVSQPIYQSSVARWKNYKKFLEPHAEKLSPFIEAFGYEQW